MTYRKIRVPGTVGESWGARAVAYRLVGRHGHKGGALLATEHREQYVQHVNGRRYVARADRWVFWDVVIGCCDRTRRRRGPRMAAC